MSYLNDILKAQSYAYFSLGVKTAQCINEKTVCMRKSVNNKRRKQLIVGRTGRVIVRLKNIELERLIKG